MPAAIVITVVAFLAPMVAREWDFNRGVWIHRVVMPPLAREGVLSARQDAQGGQGSYGGSARHAPGFLGPHYGTATPFKRTAAVVSLDAAAAVAAPISVLAVPTEVTL